MQKAVLAACACLGFALAGSANAEWRCKDSTGHEYTVSQRALTDNCTLIEGTSAEPPPPPERKLKPFKSNPKEARQAMVDGKRAVLADLKDPDSAKFRGLFTHLDLFLCGEVNAKNSYGGYVGYKRFVTWGSTGSTKFDDGSLAFLEEWAKNCKGLTQQQIDEIKNR